MHSAQIRANHLSGLKVFAIIKMLIPGSEIRESTKAEDLLSYTMLGTQC